MGEIMQFPETVDEFMQQYKITDTKQVYTNGTELVPIFRMKQWFEAHKRRWIPCSERMPEPGKRVLTTDGGFDLMDSSTVDAVPLSELTALRDTLYDTDEITLHGIYRLNKLIAKYDSEEARHET